MISEFLFHAFVRKTSVVGVEHSSGLRGSARIGCEGQPTGSQTRGLACASVEARRGGTSHISILTQPPLRSDILRPAFRFAAPDVQEEQSSPLWCVESYEIALVGSCGYSLSAY